MTVPPGSAFGALLRLYRSRALWSQSELAHRCGLSERTIRYLERGAARPRSESVRLLADALRLTPDEAAELGRQAGGDAPAAPPAPAGSAGSAAPMTRQLPPDTADFVGREAETELVTAALAERPVVVLTGKPGVGKSALAVHVAHRLAGHHPDGQLWVDLHGAGPEPTDPQAVLHRVLRTLGLAAAAIPADPDERVAAYRTALAGRRVLVVLDDAGREAQVRPLLPGSAGCAVLVTGRTRLAGLAGGRVVDVDVPDEAQAVALLAEVAGRGRVAAEPAVARAIIDRCGRLPLAVRIAGARLAARPRWPLRQLLDLLEDEASRLDQLAAGDLEVRASLALSYRALPERARRAFRLLGDANIGDFSSWVLAPLLDTTAIEAERLVDRLVDASLVDLVSRDGTDRYRLHDLVRVYARERAQAEDPADRLTRRAGRGSAGRGVPG